MQKVIEGGTPVLATDLKDTLAAFDATSVEWFYGVKVALSNALRIGPVTSLRVTVCPICVSAS